LKIIESLRKSLKKDATITFTPPQQDWKLNNSDDDLQAGPVSTL